MRRRTDHHPRPDQLDFLTVEEAAKVLRIGRTTAYALAKRYEATDGDEGLPVLRVGHKLRVPRRALEQMAGGTLSTSMPADPSTGDQRPSDSPIPELEPTHRPKPTRPKSSRDASQIRLFPEAS